MTNNTIIPTTIKKRKHYLYINKNGQQIHKNLMVVNFLPNLNNSNKNNYVAVGYTVSKKVGNAVVRNKIKRRLRALTTNFFKYNNIPSIPNISISVNIRPRAAIRSYWELKNNFDSSLSQIISLYDK